MKQTRMRQFELYFYRIGFDVICIGGDRSPLARVTSTTRGPKVGKYTVDVSSFELSVLPLLARPTSDQPQIYVIDEIGKMELFSDRFKRKVRDLFDDSNSMIFGTMPMKRGNGIQFIEGLRTRANVKVFEVSLYNRDNLFNELVQTISSNFQNLA